MASIDLAMMDDIRNRIYSIRSMQVMLDSDMAALYGVGTKVLNQAVKRNKRRFPEEFCFQLTDAEFEILKSQIVTPSWGGRRTNPYAFSEQGVAMLSAVLKSDIAVDISIKIIKAFIAMRLFIASNAQIFLRLDTLELKQLDTDRKMEQVLNAIESKKIMPKQGIFFEGQVFDAYIFISDLFRRAEKSIVIIDNYLDDSVLIHLTKRKENVKVTFLTRTISKSLAQDVRKFNEQYQPIEIKEFKNAHDRFIIIDNKTVYHFGASLKDLGKKWFAFSKMDIGAGKVLAKLNTLE
ncbi:MAG: ORF6N domain-containing protein [Candidatus Thermoplasmatota archaeon]|nr:ORF6N domain-containing protein [Euryarchaeota archaeon]MBU4031547.1 ORF6N domain-containing protein [Candidatus Thermoplasmatota archaeon]MBU4071521.1 ORF6N domain-containing protein [Candidatus Thermoplasmatota archaeon]MBU4144712.1 ORF6N domain-containing protein [Candidatus Thermoplasmatota archaeon]MBU4592691.1 ORF6N domain-containing protein [Candidatus Thermoplasmatota archaeon]